VNVGLLETELAEKLEELATVPFASQMETVCAGEYRQTAEYY
jgi:hypothetical protein